MAGIQICRVLLEWPTIDQSNPRTNKSLHLITSGSSSLIISRDDPDTVYLLSSPYPLLTVGPLLFAKDPSPPQHSHPAPTTANHEEEEKITCDLRPYKPLAVDSLFTFGSCADIGLSHTFIVSERYLLGALIAPPPHQPVGHEPIFPITQIRENRCPLR